MLPPAACKGQASYKLSLTRQEWTGTVSTVKAYITREAPDGWGNPLQVGGFVMYQHSHGEVRQREMVQPEAHTAAISRVSFHVQIRVGIATISRTACTLRLSSAMYGCSSLAVLIGCAWQSAGCERPLSCTLACWRAMRPHHAFGRKPLISTA